MAIMTVERAAEATKVSKAKIYRLLKKGKIAKVHLASGFKGVNTEEILAAIKS